LTAADIEAASEGDTLVPPARSIAVKAGRDAARARAGWRGSGAAFSFYS
jgi:hypothetical protein